MEIKLKEGSSLTVLNHSGRKILDIKEDASVGVIAILNDRDDSDEVAALVAGLVNGLYVGFYDKHTEYMFMFSKSNGGDDVSLTMSYTDDDPSDMILGYLNIWYHDGDDEWHFDEYYWPVASNATKLYKHRVSIHDSTYELYFDIVSTKAGAFSSIHDFDCRNAAVVSIAYCNDAGDGNCYMLTSEVDTDGSGNDHIQFRGISQDGSTISIDWYESDCTIGPDTVTQL